MAPAGAQFGRRTLDELEIEDEASFAHVGLYGDLKEVVRRERYAFRTLPEGKGATWDRALLLNLAFWGADEGGDVLVDATIPADVVAHVAWHRLAVKGLAGSDAASGTPPARPPADAMFLGEAIASAFDLYLVGRLIGHAPDSSFLATQVEAMAETASAAGLPEKAFEKMLYGLAGDPEGAFASLRELLVDAAAGLFACDDAESALGVLERLSSRRFAPLLHRYELANWVLYARAYGSPEPSPEAVAVEASLRAAKDPLAWLVDAWVAPALV